VIAVLPSPPPGLYPLLAIIGAEAAIIALWNDIIAPTFHLPTWVPGAPIPDGVPQPVTPTPPTYYPVDPNGNQFYPGGPGVMSI
jgi:hypothetical protein